MRSKADDARFWDRTARKYARDPIKDMAGYERTLERAQGYLKRTDAVLELGCGTGTTALRLAPHVGHILATDVSREMIAIARKKTAADSYGNVEFAVASAEDVAAPEGSFDAVLAFNVLHLVPDRWAALARARRLLKAGGLLLSKTPCLAEMNPLIRLAVPLMQRVGMAPTVAVFTAAELEHDIATADFAVLERARHGSGRSDPRIFIAARKPD